MSISFMQQQQQLAYYNRTTNTTTLGPISQHVYNYVYYACRYGFKIVE